MSEINIVHESKWGFHACDRDTAAKLRFLNRCYAKALKWRGTWERWVRKQEENRKGPEPRQVPVYEWTHRWPWQFKPPLTSTDPIRISGFGEDVREAARIARTVYKTKEEVPVIRLHMGVINTHFAFLKKWVEDNKVEL